MNTLDCSNFSSALLSTCKTLNLREETLVNILTELPDTPDLNQRNLDYFEELLYRVNYKYEKVNAMWFHGTRIMNVDTFFEQGLLPKSDAYKNLTPVLERLASHIEYKGDTSSSFGLSKFGKELIGNDDEGPFATLFKQKALHKNYPFHKMPEAVGDIAEALKGANHRMVTEMYSEITRPAIVEFIGYADDVDVMNALYYLHQVMHSESEYETANRINAYFKGEGRIVGSQRIKQIHFLDNNEIIINKNWNNQLE